MRRTLPNNKEERLLLLKQKAAELPDFVWIPDFVSISGSTIFAEREPNDLDTVIRMEGIDSMLTLKLKRVLEETLGASPHIILEPAGPNWSYLPIYDLVLRKKSQFIVQEIEEPEFKEKLYHQRAASEKVLAEAKKSFEENRLEPFRFYLPMKPTRITLPGQRQIVDRFCSYFSEDDFPILNSKKYDGMHIIIHRKGNRVEIWTEDGSEVTNSLPSLIKEILKLTPSDFIIEAELEQWLKDIHQPREAVAAKLHRTTIESDDDLIANVFTCVYLEGEDLHKKTEEERQKALSSIGIDYSTFEIPDLKHKLNLVPNLRCGKVAELKESTTRLRYLPASEGVVAKKADSIYFLDGDSKEGWIKFHNSATLKARVIETIETKTKGIFNYRYGILPGSYQFKQADLKEDVIEVGKTFSTSTKCQRGDIIEIEFETFNITHNEKMDYYTVSAWAPIFLNALGRGTPNTVDEVVERAEKEHILQEKVITEEGATVYL